MNIILRKVIVAILAVASVAIAPVASAVYVNANGLGQALIYPYYTGQAVGGNPYNTFISVVNHTADSKVVRVRFREGRNSREVANFNLYLGGLDTWTAAVVPTESGARLITTDQSCTNGPFVLDGGSVSLRRYDFTSTSYTGNAADGLGTGLDRTREGYVEMIEMATLAGASDRNVRPADQDSTTPSNCAAVQGLNPTIETNVPSGGLSGTLTVINVAKGMDFTVNAVALAELTTQQFYRNYDDSYPDFNSAEVRPVSHFIAQGKSYQVSVATGADAVAAALMVKSISNETTLDSATKSGTDWILTLPTRRFNRPALAHPPTAYPPGPAEGLSAPLIWKARDGTTLTLVDSCAGACPPSTFVVGTHIPWAATVWTFRRGSEAAGGFVSSSTVLGSSNAVLLTLPTTAESGAGTIGLNRVTEIPFQGTAVRLSDGVAGPESGSIGGIPMVGFMVRTFENGNLVCATIICQGNYGGSFPHTAEQAF